jgi:ABC-type antimicrobial peptide transport system permease subunit
MLLLKEFFRKKTTKIYFVILTIIFLGITVFFCFANYYSGLYDHAIKKNSAFVMLSEKDHYDELNKSNILFDIQRGLIFEPDYSYIILGRQGMEVKKDGIIISKKDPIYGETDFFWEDFAEFNNNIVVFKASNYDLNLNIGEIALGYLPNSRFTDEKLAELIDEKLGFNIGNLKKEFIITDFYKSPLLSMAISDEDFTNLVNYSSLYFYKASVKDLKKAEKLEISLKNLEKNNNYTVHLYVWNDGVEGDKIIELAKIVEILKNVSYLISILFVIVFYFIVKNIVKDELKNSMLKRMIGFTRWKLIKIIISELLLLITFSLLFSTLLSKISLFIINKYFNIEIKLNSLFMIVFIYIISIIITLIICLFNRNLKKIVRYA